MRTTNRLSHEAFGAYLRERREALRTDDPSFSLRRVAEQIGIQPSYLSQVERGQAASLPSEETLERLARVLGEEPDVVLAMAGKVSRELQEVILRRPRLFGELLRELRDAPEAAVLRVVREVKDGEW
jgi:HTH-type transcriptional regulator, competence development regulator